MIDDQNSEINMQEIVLAPEDAINPQLQKPLSETKFGGEVEIEKHNIKVRIGQRPIVRSLRELYLKADKELPPDLQVFSSFRLWMITHVVSVVRERGMRDISHLSYEVQFPSEPRVTTVQVIPQTQFIKKLEGGVKTNWIVDVGLGVNGQVAPPVSATELLEQKDLISFGGEAKANIDLSNKIYLVGNLSFAVLTPLIAAVGVGGDYCRWDFTKDNVPLVGDHLMVQILLVPKHDYELEFQARVSATITVFKTLPYTRRSKWIDLMAHLPRGK
ncbi:MAG: hypothetical protein M3367_05870 [Acidobacteriota bacterium]|nr:hypothetical protein [Acidobacteriota bacterium]